jgi:hypothetical protein
MKTKEEVEELLKNAENMRDLDYKQMGTLMEDEEGNADEILSIRASSDRLTGAIQSYKLVLGI